MPKIQEVSSNRLLELELMHQWSTSTYKSLCSTKEVEFHTWQVILPREGFKHPFLLHGFLAMASLEIAAVGNQPNNADYVSAALEYHDSALSSFRSELINITSDKQQAMLAFSMITMILSLALPQYTKCRHDPHSMMENMVTHFELTRGVGTLTKQHWDVLRETPILRNFRPFEASQTEDLEPNLASAIARLNTLNDARHNPTLDQSRALKLQAITYHAACRKAIFYLEELFSRCDHPFDKGYTLAWLNLAGREYVVAVENADPVALLALMHWGVLAQKCGKRIWWARSVGESLVDEITKMLSGETNPLMRASVLWAREQVSL